MKGLVRQCTRIANTCLGASPRPVRTSKQQLVQRDAQQSPDSSRGEQNDSNKTNGIPPEKEYAECSATAW